jgi:hypothetical protein
MIDKVEETFRWNIVNFLKILPAEPTTIAHHSGMNKYKSKTEIHTSFL